MSKWDMVRDSFERAHADLFDGARYEAEFYNYTQGQADFQNDEVLHTRDSDPFATEDVEIVPPAQDSTVELEGTSFGWSTSIRLPESDAAVSEFKPYGEDNQKPTEVEITDQKDDSTEVYQLQSYTTELGSGMIMIRLTEL